MDRNEVSRLITEAQRPLLARLQRLEGRVTEFAGDPNGNVDAAPGTLCADRGTPDAWKKTSALGTLTGWVAV